MKNDESGLRRSNRKWKPIVREDYISYLTVEKNDIDFFIISEALNSQQRDQ